MGEYAIRKSDGAEIKIGTCEQMYYLRADQVHKVSPMRNSVDPTRRSHAESIRFRFPFPQEDGTPPGQFEDYDYGFGLAGIEPPEEPNVEHYSIQFQAKGMLLSIPCPRGRAGKANPLNIGYNGYSGPVHIHSQRLVGKQLVLVLRCGDCGALYRVPTLEDAQPVLDVLAAMAENERRGLRTDDESRGKFYDEIARRITAGYTEPNYWTTLDVEQMTQSPAES